MSVTVSLKRNTEPEPPALYLFTIDLLNMRDDQRIQQWLEAHEYHSQDHSPATKEQTGHLHVWFSSDEYDEARRFALFLHNELKMADKASVLADKMIRFVRWQEKKASPEQEL